MAHFMIHRFFEGCLVIALAFAISMPSSAFADGDEQANSSAPNYRRHIGCFAVAAALAYGSWVIWDAWGDGVFDPSSSDQLKTHLEKNSLEIEHPLQVVFYGQWHDVKGLENQPKDVVSVGLSQWNLIQRILEAKKNGPIQVFAEGHSADLTKEQRTRILEQLPKNLKMDAKELGNFVMTFPKADQGAAKNLYLAHMAFPEGLPKQAPPQGWTNIQLGLLVRGGHRLLWALGEIDSIRAAEDAKQNAKAGEWLDKKEKGQVKWPGERREFRRAVYTDRELEALTRMVRYRNANPNDPSTFFLIYGGAHPFEAYQMPALDIRRIREDD